PTCCRSCEQVGNAASADIRRSIGVPSPMCKTGENATKLAGADCIASSLPRNFRVPLLTEIAVCSHRVLLSDRHGRPCRLTPNLAGTLPPAVALPYARNQQAA